MEVYSEPSRVSKMGLVTKLVYEFKPLTVFFFFLQRAPSEMFAGVLNTPLV